MILYFLKKIIHYGFVKKQTNFTDKFISKIIFRKISLKLFIILFPK